MFYASSLPDFCKTHLFFNENSFFSPAKIQFRTSPSKTIVDSISHTLSTQHFRLLHCETKKKRKTTNEREKKSNKTRNFSS